MASSDVCKLVPDRFWSSCLSSYYHLQVKMVSGPGIVEVDMGAARGPRKGTVVRATAALPPPSLAEEPGEDELPPEAAELPGPEANHSPALQDTEELPLLNSLELLDEDNAAQLHQRPEDRAQKVEQEGEDEAQEEWWRWAQGAVDVEEEGGAWTGEAMDEGQGAEEQADPPEDFITGDVEEQDPLAFEETQIQPPPASPTQAPNLHTTHRRHPPNQRAATTAETLTPATTSAPGPSRKRRAQEAPAPGGVKRHRRTTSTAPPITPPGVVTRSQARRLAAAAAGAAANN